MISWFVSERLALTAVLAMVFTCEFMFPISPHLAQAAERKAIRWLFNGPGIAAIAADAEASRLLDNGQPFLVTGRNVTAIPPGWNAIPFASFTSFRAIKSALERGTLAHDVEGIIYDNENWQFTPEQQRTVITVKETGATYEGCRSKR